MLILGLDRNCRNFENTDRKSWLCSVPKQNFSFSEINRKPKTENENEFCLWFVHSSFKEHEKTKLVISIISKSVVPFKSYDVLKRRP